MKLTSHLHIVSSSSTNESTSLLFHTLSWNVERHLYLRSVRNVSIHGEDCRKKINISRGLKDNACIFNVNREIRLLDCSVNL